MVRVAAVAVAQVEGKASGQSYLLCLKNKKSHLPQGRRVRKTNTSPLIGDTVYHYDSAGRLIVETGPDGSTRREYLYLLDIPVGVSVSR